MIADHDTLPFWLWLCRDGKNNTSWMLEQTVGWQLRVFIMFASPVVMAPSMASITILIAGTIFCLTLSLWGLPINMEYLFHVHEPCPSIIKLLTFKVDKEVIGFILAVLFRSWNWNPQMREDWVSVFPHMSCSESSSRPVYGWSVKY